MNLPQILILLLLELILLASLQAQNTESGRAWWARDSSNPDAIRLGDMRRADRVEIKEGVVRLFAEHGGKLVLYWEASDKKCAAEVKQQVLWAPSVFVSAGSGIFVRKDSVASAIFKKNEFGREVAALRGISVELATVSDPEVVTVLKRLMKIPESEEEARARQEKEARAAERISRTLNRGAKKVNPKD